MPTPSVDFQLEFGLTYSYPAVIGDLLSGSAWLPSRRWRAVG